MPFDCPACGRPLKETSVCLDLKQTEVVLWCPWGFCRSDKSNFGAMGKTAEEAYETLVKLIEHEPDRN